MTLFGTSTTWKKEPLYIRLNTCATMLAIHGMLTDAERKKVHKRLMKALKKARRAHK